MSNSMQSPDRWDDSETKEWKTAAEAGEKFSSLYYRAFDIRRSDLPGFFMENAQLIWNGNRTEGRQSIMDFLNKLPKSNINLHSMSAQPIHKDLTGETPLYLVNVMGTVKFEQHQPRIFSDTFFLTKDDSLWRVQSATFRFLD